MNMPFVSVIIPCRNEASFIRECLDSILAQDFPKDRLEVLVVDGMSTDGTREIVKEYEEKNGFIRLLDNPRKIVPAALNIGIEQARGSAIMRMDAHVVYGQDYIRLCVNNLLENGVDNVGGVCVTVPGREGLMAEAIAISLSHPFGVGNSYFRIGSKEPRLVDTVPFGCYKREVFERIGLFDEDLVRNQDDEFNLRLIKNGGKILLVPEIVSHYYARDSLVKLWKMYFQYGYFKPLVALKLGISFTPRSFLSTLANSLPLRRWNSAHWNLHYHFVGGNGARGSPQPHSRFHFVGGTRDEGMGIFTWRQLVPAGFVGSLGFFGFLALFSRPALWLFLTILGSYVLANLAFSASIAVKKGWRYFLVLPLVFATLHFSYGLGYLKGIWDFVIMKRHLKKPISDLPITR